MESGISYLTGLNAADSKTLASGIILLVIVIAAIAFLKNRQRYFYHNCEKGKEKITGWMPPAPGKKWDIYDIHIAENYKRELKRREANGEDISEIW